MIKYIQQHINHIKTMVYTLVGCHKQKSEDYKIYLRHMKNTTGTPKERWAKVLNTIIDPMVILPIVIGLGLILISKCVTEEIIKSILYYLSAFGIGIGVNHFSTTFKDQAEYKNLKNKAEHTVRLLNDRIKAILRKGTLTNEDKDTIDSLLNLMDYWKDYYDKVDASKIAYHKKLKTKICHKELKM